MLPLFHACAVHITCRVVESRRAVQLLRVVNDRMPGLAFAEADVDDVKAFSSEFNVRKRMVPRILVFNSRARMAEVIKLNPDEMMNEDVFARNHVKCVTFDGRTGPIRGSQHVSN